MAKNRAKILHAAHVQASQALCTRCLTFQKGVHQQEHCSGRGSTASGGPQLKCKWRRREANQVMSLSRGLSHAPASLTGLATVARATTGGVNKSIPQDGAMYVRRPAHAAALRRQSHPFRDSFISYPIFCSERISSLPKSRQGTVVAASSDFCFLHHLLFSAAYTAARPSPGWSDLVHRMADAISGRLHTTRMSSCRRRKGAQQCVC